MKRPSLNLRGVAIPSGIAAWTWLTALILLVGCQRQGSDVPSGNSTSQTNRSAPKAPADVPTAPSPTASRSPATAAQEAPVVVQQPERELQLVAEDQQAEVFPPEVLLSSGHRALCRFQVGDTFPDLQLTSLDQQPTSLSAVLGQRLTIVVFWRGGQPMSIEQIRHVQDEFARRYHEAGVSVVTINVGDPLEEVRSLQTDIQDDVVCLSDTEGNAFAQVAEEVLPQTYLLRADRQVVWFDVEYSRSMRRELRNAILYVLRQFAQQANTGSPSLM